MATRSSKLTGSFGAVYGYLSDDGYYDLDVAWGKAAKGLGLDRGISRDQAHRLFVGQHPNTGEQLARTGYKKVVHEDGTEETILTRTPMIDFVYGAPKSVAELYVQATPALRKQLDLVMMNAAHEAFKAMESSAKLARVPVKTPAEVGARTTKQQGSQTERTTADLIALPVIQYTARPTEESIARGVPDPQIHVHVPIFTLCQVGDRWYTADEFGAKNRTNAKFRDSVFMGELARGLESLGIDVDYAEFDRARGGEVSWEVKGSNAQLRRYWSTNNERAWKIRRDYEDKHGKPIDEVKLGEVLYKTRKSKTAATKRQDSRPNWDLWRDDATRAGFQLTHIDQQRPIEHSAFRAADKLRLRLLSANGLCIDEAVFDEASIRPAIARCAVGLGFSPTELDGCARALLGSDGRDLVLVRDANDPEHRLYTTRTMLQAEHDIAETRDRNAGRWVDITGRAGTGKSALTSVAVDALRSLAPREVSVNGQKVTVGPAPISEAISAALDRPAFRLDDEQVAGVHAIVKAAAGADQVLCVSMAASTAERTGLKIKADAWGSVESVVSRIEKGPLKTDRRTLVVIEEAGQLDTLRMDRLLKAVGDARIVTLGDTKQLSAIGGAGWYADSLERHGSIELTEVRRQQDQRDVDDYALVRDGHADRALENLASRGRVHVSAENTDRLSRVFEHYRDHRTSGRLARDIRIVLDSSNQDVDTANRFVQRDRLARNEISPHSVEVENEEQGRRWRLHENDQVILLSTARVQGEDPVKNGTTGVIKRLDAERQRARVKLDDGREVNIPTSSAIGLAYAVHIAKFQGGECPIALCVPGRSTSRNSGYTMVTRGVEESHIYVSAESGGIEALAQKWSIADEKETATAVVRRVRAEMELEDLPPARSDELVIDDIDLEPIPELDPVQWYGHEPLEQFVPERLVEPSMDDLDFGPSIEME